MDNADLAWSAGLFEGEGSIAIARYRRDDRGAFRLNLTLRMTDEQCVEAFYDALGIGYVSFIGRIPPWRPVWGWSAGGKAALAALQAMLPYFRSDRVRTKAELAIEFQLARRVGTPARDPLYKAIQAEQHERMRILNLRGQDAIDHEERQT
jgi:hypothetical protein